VYELLLAWFGRRSEVVTVSTKNILTAKIIPLFNLVMIIELCDCDCSGRMFGRKDSQINYYNSIAPVAVAIVIVFCIFSRCFVRVVSVYSCAWYSLPVVWLCGCLV